VLEDHGYLLAEAAITVHVSSLAPPPRPALVLSHLDWMNESRVQEALKGSAKRTLLGRF
jgi:hypothetical protein